MSPLPIIARQRALSRVGEIRIGGEKPDRGAGRKLEAFRLTSQHRDIIERCAGLYGGEPTGWQSPNGDAWQLYTTTAALPCMVIVGYSLQQIYERWEGATKCTRRCDGEEEFISGGACLCNKDGEDVCDIVSRLMVVLPETGTSLGWQLRSIGENAARELSGAIDLADGFAQGRSFVPATLRLTQRRSVLNGQTVRYTVPVLDFNLAQAILSDGVERPALPAGYTPLPAAPTGVSVAEGLAAAERRSEPATRTARSAAPIGPEESFLSDEPVPVPDERGIGGSAPADPTPRTDETPPPRDAQGKGADPVASVAQKKKLNVLVGKLRDAGYLTTEHLYKGLDLDPEMGRGADGKLHWSPLRESLSKTEASGLIERLTALEEKVAKPTFEIPESART